MLQYALLLLSDTGCSIENNKAKEYIPVSPDETWNITLCYRLLSQINPACEIQYEQWKRKLFKEDLHLAKKSLLDGFMGFYRLLY
jgi:hypothetical protein